jgi:aminoglycoside phosphotransferase (APT) family kinase protein
MHVDEIDIDEALVHRLLREQFPEWSELPLSRVQPQGTVNAIFRLGEKLSVRLARRGGPIEPGGKEFRWLPRLAPLLPVAIPAQSRKDVPLTTTHGSGKFIRGSRARQFRSRRSTRSRRRATSPNSLVRFSR